MTLLIVWCCAAGNHVKCHACGTFCSVRTAAYPSTIGSMAAFHASRIGSSTPHIKQHIYLLQVRQTFFRLSPVHSSQQKGVDVIAIVEGAGQPTADATARSVVTSPIVSSDAVSTARSNSKDTIYKALLAIILKLSSQAAADPQQPQQQQLEVFLKAQPVATSIPFISWMADLEAKATGAHKVQLAKLCEALMVFREAQDQQKLEQLYHDTVQLLTGGNEQVTAVLAAEPQQYALALAEGLTGQPVAVQGYSPAYDLLLQVAPAAALTPESVAQGHQLAAELGNELTTRRKSTLAAMLGRTKLTPDQQAQLMGGSPAARICDLLLTLDNTEERIALLPDCFTPPGDGEDVQDATAAAAAAAAGSSEQQQQQQQGVEEETEELWCTPMQLLNEIESRLKAAARIADQQQQAAGSSSERLLGGGSSVTAFQQQQQLLPAGGSEGLRGAAAVAALEELRYIIQEQWLDSLPITG